MTARGSTRSAVTHRKENAPEPALRILGARHGGNAFIHGNAIRGDRKMEEQARRKSVASNPSQLGSGFSGCGYCSRKTGKLFDAQQVQRHQPVECSFYQ
jgi:hypothetical protein